MLFGALFDIEPQIGLTLFLIRTVTGHAAINQQTANVAVELDWFLGRRSDHCRRDEHGREPANRQLRSAGSGRVRRLMSCQQLNHGSAPSHSASPPGISMIRHHIRLVTNLQRLYTLRLDILTVRLDAELWDHPASMSHFAKHLSP